MVENPLDPNPNEPDYFLYHDGGPWLRATFRCATDAYVWQEGNRGRPWAERFFITDRAGSRVTLHEHARRPGHAYALMQSTGELA